MASYWSLRCSWSIACRRCSNYIFILDLTPGFNGLGKDNYKTRRETFRFSSWDLVRLILEIWRYLEKSLMCDFVFIAVAVVPIFGSVSYTWGTGNLRVNSLRPRQNGAILQTTVLDAFVWTKIYQFRLRFHWSLFLRVQITIFLAPARRKAIIWTNDDPAYWRICDIYLISFLISNGRRIVVGRCFRPNDSINTKNWRQ